MTAARCTVSTLLYCFNGDDSILLMKRRREPNRGLWSPCGGKVHLNSGESPYACACREAFEEIHVQLVSSDLHLAGLITEQNVDSGAHWLMFLFEVRRKLEKLPPPHAEGEFRFFAKTELPRVALPESDAHRIWPLFWKHRGGFFSAACCIRGGLQTWEIEETVRPAR